MTNILQVSYILQQTAFVFCYLNLKFFLICMIQDFRGISQGTWCKIYFRKHLKPIVWQNNFLILLIMF